MNKETSEIIKSILDMFVKREELLKELLDNKETENTELKKQVIELEESLAEFYK